MEVSGQRHTPAALIPGKDIGINWNGGWVQRRAGLDLCVDEQASAIPVGTLTTLPRPSLASIEEG
jgi:hypothetical protein